MQRTAYTRLGAALLLVLSVSLLTSGCRGTTKTKAPIHPNWNMDQQRRYDPQEPSRLHWDRDGEPFFSDGRAMRLPVQNTVHTGWLLDDDDATAHYYDGRHGDQLAHTLPDQVQLSQALLDRGQERYEIFCAPCHGLAGAGDGAVAPHVTVTPTAFHSEFLREQPIGHFVDVINNGVRTMPAYRSQVPADDRWAIAAYIRVLQAATAAGQPAN